MDDMQSYKETFISEARDHLDTLNEGLLELEKGTDDDTVNRLFRAFHTLKGNSAAMGFMNFSELAHSLEDVLGKIREKELKIDQRITDLLFEGCDILEEGLETISEKNADEIDIIGVVTELKDIMGITDEMVEVTIPKTAELSKDEEKELKKLKKQKMDPHRIIVVFDRKNPLKGAKALLLLRDLSNDHELIKTTPSMNDIKAGKFDVELEFVVASKTKKEDLEKTVTAVSDITHVFVLGLDEAYERPPDAAPPTQEEKERQKAAIANKHTSSVVKEIRSVKVEMTKLDILMNLVGELLINNIQLQEINRKHNITELKTLLSNMNRLSEDLQDEVMQIRMVPIGNIFNRFPRMVRDLANKEKKKVNFTIEGQEIEFDRTVLDEIGDPLVHLLRNAVDHGIESPGERTDAGKPEEGAIKLIARREKNYAAIEVDDDGYGIDPEKVKESCIKKGIITAEDGARMSKNELQKLIFRAGASTNKEVTDVSGRGVGMDVVDSKMKELGGTIELRSEVGKGTRIIMRRPLTVAIVNSLLVGVHDDT